MSVNIFGYIKRGSIVLIALIMFFTVPAEAISSEQRRLYHSGVSYYDIDEYCGINPFSAGANSAVGDASGYPVRVPVISDPDALAAAIDQFILETRPNSPYAGMGQYFVQGGMRAEINPIMVVTISLKETQLATISGSGMAAGSHNSFGRTANPRTQPYVETNRYWYKWDSWQASLFSEEFPADGTVEQPDDIFQYIARRFESNLDNFEDFLEQYAPSFENDTAQYINDVLRWSDLIVDMAGEDVVDLGQIGSSVTTTASGTERCPPTTRGQPAGIENFVFYSQNDEAWRNYPFGSSRLGPSGCGPTSVAMVVATFVDSSVTPIEVADKTHQYYIAGSGSSWALFTEGIAQWGLSSRDIGANFDAARDALDEGSLIIARGNGPMPFTRGGHVIVIRGHDGQGGFYVGDPQERQLREEPYDQARLAGSNINMWVISR